MVYDWDIAQELAHDVFIKVYQKNLYLDPDSQQTANYFITVAKHAAIDYLRRKKIEEEKLQKLYFETVSMDRDFYEDIENIVINGEILSTLADVIDSFPVKEQEVYIKKNILNKKYSSIAHDVNLSEYKIKQINHEMHQKIKIMLRPFF